MSIKTITEMILDSWKRNNDISISICSELSKKQLNARPSESRGRTVCEQLIHINQVRISWVHYHKTGKRLSKKDLRGIGETRAKITKAFEKSGNLVYEYLKAALDNGDKIRMFKGDPIRWYTYLISHESHHRGSIMLALKQSGEKISEESALAKLWGKWIFGE